MRGGVGVGVSVELARTFEECTWSDMVLMKRAASSGECEGSTDTINSQLHSIAIACGTHSEKAPKHMPRG